MSFIYFILVGLIAGWLASVLVKGGGSGVVVDIIVGVIGALLGGWVFGMLGISAGGGLAGSIITATIGAILFILILRVIKRS